MKLLLHLCLVTILGCVLSGQSQETQAPPPKKAKPHPINPLDTGGSRGEKRIPVGGTLIDANGTGVAEAKLLITSTVSAAHSWTTRTDDAGRFELPGGIAPGTYMIEAIAKNHKLTRARDLRIESRPVLLAIPLEEGSSKETSEFKLEKIEAAVANPRGQPVVGAKITARVGKSTAEIAPVEAIEDHYEIPNLAPGTYTVEVSAPGYLKSATLVTLPHSGIVHLKLEPQGARKP